MDTVLQPHESHTNHVLQWMMDYNLQGMNPVNCCVPPHSRGHTTFCFQIHLSHALFRQGRLRDEYDDMEPVVEVPWRKARTRGRHPSLDSSLPSQTQDAGTVLSSYLSIPPGERLFCVEDMAECLKLPAEVSYRSIISYPRTVTVAAPVCRCPASPPRSWSWTPWPRTSSTTRT